MSPMPRTNRYQTISHSELVARALEMKQEITYRKARVARELRELDRAALLFRNLGATRLAQACGADPVVIEAIAGMEPDVAERAANAVANRRWREAATLHTTPAGQPLAADHGQSAEGIVG